MYTTQHNDTEDNYAQYNYKKDNTQSMIRLFIMTLHPECHVFIVMLSVAMLNVVKLSVIMLNVAGRDKTAFGSTESFE